jgi:hypothetical protein
VRGRIAPGGESGVESSRGMSPEGRHGLLGFQSCYLKIN